jgi:hypothetical protein
MISDLSTFMKLVIGVRDLFHPPVVKWKDEWIQEGEEADDEGMVETPGYTDEEKEESQRKSDSVKLTIEYTFPRWAWEFLIKAYDETNNFIYAGGIMISRNMRDRFPDLSQGLLFLFQGAVSFLRLISFIVEEETVGVRIQRDFERRDAWIRIMYMPIFNQFFTKIPKGV